MFAVNVHCEENICKLTLKQQWPASQQEKNSGQHPPTEQHL